MEAELASAAQAAGWKAVLHPPVGARQADILIAKGKYRYVVELKNTSEGRRDRLIPALSQAILQARSFAALASPSARPLAVVAAPEIPAAAVRALRAFAHEHAPDVAVGVMDQSGLRVFVGPGLESLNAESQPAARRTSPVEPTIDLFSDLNQWMLKVLLAPHIGRAELMPADLPRSDFRNASELAKAARVSVMSAFRFVRQLDREGFLGEARDQLRLVRLDALLDRWKAVNRRPARELLARWILPADNEELNDAVGALGPRSCVGLFSALRAMGLGHVRGVPAYFYVDDFRPERLKAAGLVKAAPGDRVDVALRIPLVRESVFRGVINAGALPATDVLQSWLDVSAHPARGQEQADVIYRKVINPMIDHVNDTRR
jgi:hypothetical protein